MQKVNLFSKAVEDYIEASIMSHYDTERQERDAALPSEFEGWKSPKKVRKKSRHQDPTPKSRFGPQSPGNRI